MLFEGGEEGGVTHPTAPSLQPCAAAEPAQQWTLNLNGFEKLMLPAMPLVGGNLSGGDLRGGRRRAVLAVRDARGRGDALDGGGALRPEAGV